MANALVPAGEKPATKPRPMRKKLSRAIDALIGGEAKTKAAAAELAGMSREAFSRALARPEVIAELRARVERNLKGAALAQAGAVMETLLAASSEHVQFKAAEHLLGISGIRPPPANTVVQANLNVGYVIDLRTDLGVTSEHRVVQSSDAGCILMDIEPVTVAQESHHEHRSDDAADPCGL